MNQMNGQQRRLTAGQTKLVAMAVLALLATIIILQNTDPVETRILFFRITLPLAVLLFSTTLIGFALGVVASLLAKRRHSTTEQPRR